MHRIPFIIYPHVLLMSLASKQKKEKAAWWSLGMTWILLLVFTWAAGGFPAFFEIARNFFTGDLAAVKELGGSNMVPVIAATSAVLIPMMVAISSILDKHVPPETSQNLRNTSPKRLFAIVMITLLCEELLFRFPFLGLMTKIPKLDGTGFFYLLSVIGNLLFAWVHLMMNFSRQDRKWIIVLPQFVGGIFLTMIYASHGFFAAFGAHVIYDMIVFCANKHISFQLSRFILSFYHLFFLGVYSLLFFGVRDHSLLDIKLVVENGIPNWGFIDYCSLVGILTASTFLVLELLWYDLEQVSPSNLVNIGLLVSLAYLAVLLINNYLPEYLLISTVGAATTITFLEKSISESGVSRLFWKSVLLTFVILIMQKADWETALCVLLLFLLHQLVEGYIRFLGPLHYPTYFLHIYGQLVYFTWRYLKKNKTIRLKTIVPVTIKVLGMWKIVKYTKPEFDQWKKKEIETLFKSIK